MPKEFYSASEAAKTLGISVDTLRRWDRQGRIATNTGTIAEASSMYSSAVRPRSTS